MPTAVYNYLASSVMNETALRNLNKVHKRSELRSIYNTIVTINKNSPLYKVDLTKENQNLAIGLKDLSLQISDMTKSLYQETPDSVFRTVKAGTDDPASASVELVSDNQEDYPEPFTLKINSLATNQINQSLPVSANTLNPAAGNYAFTVEIEGNAYSFQYHIKENTTNQDTLGKLADFINKSNIGLVCSNKKNESNTIQMKLESMETGMAGGPIFRLYDTKSPEGSVGLVEYYGLNQTAQEAANAQFEINGEEKQSLSNQILLNKALQISFLQTSQVAAGIDYRPDSETIFAAIDDFRSRYNQMIDLADSYPSTQGMPQKLLYQLKRTSEPYHNELEACGITFESSGKMQLDRFLTVQSIESGEINHLFSNNGYLKNVDRQISSIILNPMHYVDKTLVTYPDFAKPSVSNPYISSIYSGMMFNYYC